MAQPDPIPNDPINPLEVSKLSNEQLDQLIAARRERRLKAVKEFKKAQDAKRKSDALKVSERLDKHFEMFMKEQERVDAALEKLAKRLMDIRALRLQLGDLTALEEMVSDGNQADN